MLDLLIRNGTVIDGTGAPRRPADVAIQGDTITAVEPLPGAQAAIVLDAAGLVVCPGFIDMHSHADEFLPAQPTADSLVMQGITTVVAGQCGGTPVPLLPETRAQLIARRDLGEPLLPWERWTTFASYLDTLRELGTSLNVVELVGQGTVRAAVLGYVSDAPTPAQLARMQAQVAQAMDEGALGLSTGLVYAPGSYATTEEIVALAMPVGARQGYYFSHIRGEGATLLEAVAEAIAIGRQSGAAVQISHFKAMGEAHWTKAARGLALIDAARAEGLDVAADMYPYLAGSSGLSSMLPLWAHAGGKEFALQRLADPATRAKMSAEMQGEGFMRTARWDQVLIATSPARREYEGRYVAELAAAEGKTPHEWIFDALLESELGIQMIHFYGLEDNLRMQLRHPAVMIGTDAGVCATSGPLSAGFPHPRHYGTFPRILARYVREQGVLTLEEAVRKMTGLPAQRLRWSERGLLRPGQRADVVLFDPATVADRATYEAPHQYPVGLPHVLVNGQFVKRDGAHTGARPGRVITR